MPDEEGHEPGAMAQQPVILRELNSLATAASAAAIGSSLMMAKYGRLEPNLVIEGSTGSETVPLPDLPEPAKLSVLEALGYTLAAEDRIGRVAMSATIPSSVPEPKEIARARST